MSFSLDVFLRSDINSERDVLICRYVFIKDVLAVKRVYAPAGNVMTVELRAEAGELTVPTVLCSGGVVGGRREALFYCYHTPDRFISSPLRLEHLLAGRTLTNLSPNCANLYFRNTFKLHYVF